MLEYVLYCRAVYIYSFKHLEGVKGERSPLNTSQKVL